MVALGSSELANLVTARTEMHRDAISEDCNSILRSRRIGIRAVIVTVTHVHR